MLAVTGPGQYRRVTGTRWDYLYLSEFVSVNFFECVLLLVNFVSS